MFVFYLFWKRRKKVVGIMHGNEVFPEPKLIKK